MPDMFERTLVAALATMPAPDGSAALDLRIERAIGAATLRRPRWRALPSIRRRAAVVGFVALTAAVSLAAGGTSFIDTWLSGGGTKGIWSRAERIGLSETVEGHQVTVERAYLDDTQLVIGISSDGIDLATEVSLDGRTEDQWGLRWAGSGYALDGDASATLFDWAAPDDLGPVADVALRVWPRGSTSDGEPSADAASFTFRVPNSGGARWTGSVADSASGIRARLTDLVISPTRVRGELVFDGAIPDAGGQTWDSVGMELIRGDTRLSEGISLAADGTARFDSDGGVKDAAGAWTIRIDALQNLTPRSGTGRDGHSPAPAVRTIQGPWVFHVTLSR